MINSKTGNDKLGQIAALYRKSGIGKRMVMLCAINFSGGMLQGMEVLIYMIFFFWKPPYEKIFHKGHPFHQLGKDLKCRVSRIKVYSQCEELSPDNQTGRGRFSFIFFPLFYYFFSFGENSFFIFFCWLTFPFNHFHFKTHNNFLPLH